MIADQPSLLAAGIPKPIFYAWSAIIMTIYVVSHLRVQRRYRRFVGETEVKLQRLEHEASEYERRIDEHQATVDAELARMRAELDAYGVWSDANDRFFHHGLVAVSHLIGSRELHTRRVCATERRRTHERRATAAAWRPKPTRAAITASSVDPAMRGHRRTCT